MLLISLWLNEVIKIMRKTIMSILMLFNLAGCSNIPSGVQAVQNFDVNRYSGKWYEIARLDHSFERGLTDVYTTYTLRKDGGINVLNRGFDKGGWKMETSAWACLFYKGKDGWPAKSYVFLAVLRWIQCHFA